jgi:hypothetical protein
MSLEIAFQELNMQFQKLLDAFVGLRVTVMEDKPLRDDVMLVDLLGDSVEDLLGWTTEALTASAEARQAIEGQMDLIRARRRLSLCQANFNRITHKFSTEVAAYERMAEIHTLGRERGGEWMTWGESARQAIDGCHQPLYDTSQDLFHCWREIADSAGLTSISVQATNIGQQVKVSDANELIKNGIT